MQVEGTVLRLSMHAHDGLVGPVQALMTIIPTGGGWPVEAQVLNRDVGFVRAGQPVTVTLEAFSFTRYGTLQGRLAWISRDAVTDEELGPVYNARVTVSAPPP